MLLNLLSRMLYISCTSTSSAVRLCLRQFSFRSDSKSYQPAQHTTTGLRTHKDSTTIKNIIPI